MPIKKIVNAQTGEEIEREMTADELQNYEANILRMKNEYETQLAMKNQKKILLEKLGITEEEAKLLLS